MHGRAKQMSPHLICAYHKKSNPIRHVSALPPQSKICYLPFPSDTFLKPSFCRMLS